MHYTNIELLTERYCMHMYCFDKVAEVNSELKMKRFISVHMSAAYYLKTSSI